MLPNFEQFSNFALVIPKVPRYVKSVRALLWKLRSENPNTQWSYLTRLFPMFERFIFDAEMEATLQDSTGGVFKTDLFDNFFKAVLELNEKTRLEDLVSLQKRYYVARYKQKVLVRLQLIQIQEEMKKEVEEMEKEVEEMKRKVEEIKEEMEKEYQKYQEMREEMKKQVGEMREEMYKEAEEMKEAAEELDFLMEPFMIAS